MTNKIDSMNGMDVGLLRAFVADEPKNEAGPSWPQAITSLDDLSDVDYFASLTEED
jgi:hypothetical protein